MGCGTLFDKQSVKGKKSVQKEEENAATFHASQTS